jgi:hypothetical protein
MAELKENEIPLLQVKEAHLIGMINALEQYALMIEEIAQSQPEFLILQKSVRDIGARILILNKTIHRRYDGIEERQYVKLIGEIIKRLNNRKK